MSLSHPLCDIMAVFSHQHVQDINFGTALRRAAAKYFVAKNTFQGHTSMDDND